MRVLGRSPDAVSRASSAHDGEADVLVENKVTLVRLASAEIEHCKISLERDLVKRSMIIGSASPPRAASAARP
jgi:hypothetical protein